MIQLDLLTVIGVAAVRNHLDDERGSALDSHLGQPQLGMVSGVNGTFLEYGEFVVRVSFDILYGVVSLSSPGALSVG